MTHKRILLILALVFAFIYSAGLTARTDDATKPINIKADSAEINDATGISVYRGAVKITQGSMQLTGEKVVLEMANEKVQKIIAEGSLSTFEQTTDDGRVVYAEAEKMVYHIIGNKVVLTKNAKLTEAGNTFTSDRIVFYTDKEIVSAGSSTGNDRVNITIFPETTKKETPQDLSNNHNAN